MFPPRKLNPYAGVMGLPEDVDTEEWPDAFSEEPIVAWRSWLVHPADFTLRSVTYNDFVWQARVPIQAKCDRAKYFSPHSIPNMKHGCGLHALKVADTCGSWGARGKASCGPWIVGRVSIWGTVLCFERGYRAAYAYPYALWVPPFVHASSSTQLGWTERFGDFYPQDLVKGLRERYGVDVALGYPSDMTRYPYVYQEK